MYHARIRIYFCKIIAAIAAKLDNMQIISK